MDRIWWQQVVNPKAFLEGIVDDMLHEKSIVLSLPLIFPWYETFINLIEEKVVHQNCQKSFDIIDCSSLDKMSIGQFMLEKYCKPAKRASFMPTMNHARFLAKSTDIVLNDRYVWFKNIPSDMISSIMGFIADYQNEIKDDRTKAVFILEFNGVDGVQEQKGIPFHDYGKDVRVFDTYVFAILVSSQLRLDKHLKNYVAELVTNICQSDIELCSECINDSLKFLSNPVRALKKICQEAKRSNGEEFIPYDKTIVRKWIWKTQLRLIFPMIEDYRSVLSEKYYKEIVAADHDPEEIEIGQLYYLVCDGALQVDNDEYLRIRQFRDVRNDLAHLKSLELDVIKDLIRNYQVGIK